MLSKIALFGATVSCFAAAMPEFSSAGALQFPKDYREWVYMSSGLGMTYGPAAQASPQPLFDTVFVNPPSWAAFKQTGKWPEGTMFILEIRYATSQGSINRGGHFQTDIAGIEAAVKDSKRFPGNGWAYFTFRGGLAPVANEAEKFDLKASCYGCHSANGAVDNTFTQFYPTALAIAREKGTVRAEYKPHPSSPAEVFHRLNGGEPPALLGDLKAQDPNAAALSEPVLIRIGSSLVRDGKVDQAVGLFQFCTESYPKSTAARVSLADAYGKAGRPAEANRSFQLALTLLDADPDVTANRREEMRASIRAKLASDKGNR